MTDLREAIRAAGLTEIEALNLPTEHRIISDNVITIDDIAQDDVLRARLFIQRLKNDHSR